MNEWIPMSGERGRRIHGPLRRFWAQPSLPKEPMSLVPCFEDSAGGHPIRVDPREGTGRHDVVFEVSDASPRIRRVADGSTPKESHSASGIFMFSSEEDASRLANALHHAVELCGGIPSPF